MRTVRTIGVARRVNQCATAELSGYPNRERQALRGDNGLAVPSLPAIKRSVERDVVCNIVVPGHIQGAIWAHKRRRSDRASRALRIIRTSHVEGSASVRGCAHTNA